MAELAIATTLAVLQIVVPFLTNMNRKERLDAESMRSWLRSMKAFIEKNDGYEGDKTLEGHMKEVRDIAYEIEDFLEEFILHSPPYFFHRHEISRKVHQQLHKMKHKFPLSGISDKTACITKRIGDIQSQLQTFRVSPKPGPSSRMPHQVSPLLKDGDMVGYKDKREAVVNRLKDRTQNLVRVAVVGASGSGKTTLVKNVFWDREIREQFECHAWLHMGRHYDVTDLYCKLLKQLGLWNYSYPYDHDSCLRVLRDYVANKRYLLVLDDIWVEIDRVWDYIEKAFPDTNEGSRIIVTTRRVDPSSSNQHIVTLEGLKPPQAWDLFCKKAFPDSKGQCSSDLKDLATKICTRCEGQPFAIVAVGGALARKNDPNEWERFHKRFECGSWKDSSKLNLIREALLPDYLDLDINLKSCFLYFSIFPEDYSVENGDNHHC